MPAKLSLDLGRVDGIAPIMPEAVLDKTDKAAELLFGFPGQFGQYLTDDIHNIEVLPVTTATNIVGIAHPSMTEHNVDGRTVIFDIEPVTHVRTITVYWDGLSLQTRTDNGRYKLLIMLIRAVIIGAVRRNCWQP